jgi:hypothetical protein
MVCCSWNNYVFGLCSSYNVYKKNTTFRKLDLFPSSGTWVSPRTLFFHAFLVAGALPFGTATPGGRDILSDEERLSFGRELKCNPHWGAHERTIVTSHVWVHSRRSDTSWCRILSILHLSPALASPFVHVLYDNCRITFKISSFKFYEKNT